MLIEKAKHRKTNSNYYQLYVDSKTTDPLEAEFRIMATKVEVGWKKWGVDNQNAHNLRKIRGMVDIFLLISTT